MSHKTPLAEIQVLAKCVASEASTASFVAADVTACTSSAGSYRRTTLKT